MCLKQTGASLMLATSSAFFVRFPLLVCTENRADILRLFARQAQFNWEIPFVDIHSTFHSEECPRDCMNVSACV